MGLRDRIRDTLRPLGIGVSPDEATLALRGIETMGVRLRHVGGVAERLAFQLREHPMVQRVLHPALRDCSGHDHWKRDFQGAGGVFSIVLMPGSSEYLNETLSQLSIFAIGASWGGTRSLIDPLSLAAERSIDVSLPNAGPVLRISIGVEDEEELRDDLWSFLDAMEANRQSQLRGPSAAS